ncbi:MAG: lipase family protein [Novosphingobium sp.]
MLYDPTLDALLRPQLADPLEPGLFSKSLDARCAELARLAYYSFAPDQLSRLEQALAGLGLSPPHLVEDRHRNTQAFVTLDPQHTAYVVFRGTESTSRWDIITDALFLRRPWVGKAWVHCGFRRAYDNRSARTDATNVRRVLSELMAKLAPRRMVTTGHSLGAALATLFASDHPTAELITFGSPLVGNAAFAALFAGRTVHRYRQCADFVTRVPFEWMGYHHVTSARYLDRHGERNDKADIAADIATARAEYRQRYQGLKDIVPLRDGADHAPINYISAVLGVRKD